MDFVPLQCDEDGEGCGCSLMPGPVCVGEFMAIMIVATIKPRVQLVMCDEQSAG